MMDKKLVLHCQRDRDGDGWISRVDPNIHCQLGTLVARTLESID